MQSSDTFLSGGKQSLASTLCHAGYDVYLANNRGNSHSLSSSGATADECKSPKSCKTFWDFSFDEFANFDFPTFVNAVCQLSKQKKIAVIGFSQGAAQSFAGLAVSEEMREKVGLVIALAPPIRPVGFDKGILQDCVTQLPSWFLRIMFGSKNMFVGSVAKWQRVLSPKAFAIVVTKAMDLLFGWKCEQISPCKRVGFCKNIYSDSSVLSILHWFRVIGQKKLCTFANLTPYDFSRIKTNRYAVLAGTADKLIEPLAITEYLDPSLCLLQHMEPD